MIAHPALTIPVEEGTRLLALLCFAGGFALGLFFGWLLHRERVERALYEDVVRARDRATSTLAETSARLELANRDAVRLRAQLTDAQRRLTEHDTTIARLRREAEAGVPAAEPNGDAEALGFEEADVTEEVVPTGEFPIGDGTADEELELVDEAGEELELADEADVEADVDAGPIAADAGEPAPVDDTEADVLEEAELAAVDDPEAELEVVAEEELEVVDEAELEVTDEPDVDTDDAEPEPMAPADAPQPTEAELLDELATADEVEDDAELVAAGGWYDREPATANPSLPGSDRGADAPAEVDVVAAPGDGQADDVTAAEGPVDAQYEDVTAAADDLRRIAGVGPALERALHSEGITTYRELALLDDRAIRELGDRRPRLVNRLRRDEWVAQARQLHQDTHGTSI